MPLSFIRYEVLLPVTYNDGREIEEVKHKVTFKEALQEFGGATLEPQQLQGRWLFQGQEFAEPMLRLVIEVEDLAENHEWFASWKQTLKERFEQIEIR